MYFKVFFSVCALCALVIFPAMAQDYTVDSDHDGFPDLIEQGAGFNPNENEFLKKSTSGGKCGEIKNDFLNILNPDSTLLILDISGSMSEQLGAGKETKMELAKKILAKYIDAIPASMQTGVVIYGKTDCGDDSIEVIAPIGKMNKNDIKAKINSLTPSGSTPIALTIGKCPEFLKGNEGSVNHVVLVSDGAESCGGNPVNAIVEFKKTIYNPQVSVIGLNVDSRTRKQLANIADASQGMYTDVKNEEDLVKAFAAFFDEMNKGYKDIVCIVNQYNIYLKEETAQFNKTQAYLIKAGIKAKNDAERAELKKVETLIQGNHDKRIKAKDALTQKINQKMKDMEEAKDRFVGKK